MATSAMVFRPANAFIRRSGILSRRIDFRCIVGQSSTATSTTRGAANEDTAVKVEKRSSEEHRSTTRGDSMTQVDMRRRQPPAARRQQSLSLIDSWDPFSLTVRSIGQMMDSMDRLFSSVLGVPAIARLDPAQLLIRLPWDITEDDESLHMRIDVPGFDKDEVKVRVDQDGVLVVEAERKAEEKEEDKWEAGSYGKFYTRIALPDNVEADKLKAKLKNGVLEVTVPKVKGSDKRQVIEIKLIDQE